MRQVPIVGVLQGDKKLRQRAGVDIPQALFVWNWKREYRYRSFTREIEKDNRKMDDQQQFCLRWNDFQTNMVASFKHLRDEKSFCDVTIATEVMILLNS